jgi:hypothetical protein
MLAADSVYRSVRMLPNKLKYDYERKKISQGIKKNEIESRQRNLLSDGENDYDEDEDDEDRGGGMRRGGRIPLLPDSIYSRDGTADSRSREGYDEYGDVIEYEGTGSGFYNTPDSTSGSYSDSDSGGSDGGIDSDGEGYEEQERRRTKRVVMKITEEDASASVSLIQALTAFSSEVIEGGELMKLKIEFSWSLKRPWILRF